MLVYCKMSKILAYFKKCCIFAPEIGTLFRVFSLYNDSSNIFNQYNNRMKTIYQFRGKDAKLLPIYIIFHEVVFWCFLGFVIYESICDNRGVNSIVLVLFYIGCMWFFLYYSGFKFIYYRWLMLKYDKDTTFTIDASQQIFTYVRGGKTLHFTPNDIDKWWRYKTGPGLAEFIKIIEIKLKNGEEIVISSGLEDAAYLIYYHSEELGLPKENNIMTHEKYKSFKAYIEDLE